MTRTDVDVLANALLAISESLSEVARSIDRLGNGDATSSMGAIEGLAVQVRDGLQNIADSVSSSAGDVTDAIEDVTRAVDPDRAE